MDKFSFDAIGFVRSGYREKFAVPRQPGLVSSMTATVEMLPAYSHPDAWRRLQEFSHAWLIFVFHQSLGKGWHDTVRPPRLGGNARVGVFATRSPFRPNPLGISAVELLQVEQVGDICCLHIRGADLIDGTPVLDIKPYLPYADSLAASAGFAQPPEAMMQVRFTDAARDTLLELERKSGRPLKEQIEQILSYDPRPAYQAGTGAQAEYGMHLFEFNIRFCVDGNCVSVLTIEPRDP